MNGNAMVTPAPRKKVRRERCFFVMNIVLLAPTVEAVYEAVKKWGLTPLAQQDVNEQNGLPSRGRGQTPFLHSFIHRLYSYCSVGCTFMFIWNGALLTIPNAMDEKR